MIEMGKNQNQKNFHGCLAIFFRIYSPKAGFHCDGVGVGVGVVIRSVELMI